MNHYLVYAVDVVAILALVLGLFLPRHGRRELVVAFLTVNIGVMAIAAVLADASVGAGVGLGIFGVLSIIRLRSQELAQHEVAYYFVALALGLLSGLVTSLSPFYLGTMAALLLAIYFGDHPRLTGSVRRQQLLLDRALTDEAALSEHLTELLGCRVVGVSVLRTDIVNDTTLVDVRYEPGTASVRSLTGRRAA
jgi:MFS family permease